MFFTLNDIVVFKENHKWVGCIGFINEIKPIKDNNGNDTFKIMVGVPIPQKGVAYTYATPDEIEKTIIYPYDIRSEED